MDCDLNERLNEASACGNLEEITKLLSSGAKINHQNLVNGMSPLHWSMLRNHDHVTQYLLAQGADPNIRRFDGKTPAEMHQLGMPDFVPNYLKNPTVFQPCQITPTEQSSRNNSSENQIVIKVRIANSDEQDFYEVEIPPELNEFSTFKKIVCQELDLDPEHVSKIRKLPNVIVRNSSDLKRLTCGTEIEVVMRTG